MVLCDMEFPNHGIIDSDISTNTTIAAGKVHHQQSVTAELAAPLVAIVATSRYLCQIHGRSANLISFDLTLRIQQRVMPPIMLTSRCTEGILELTLSRLER